VKRIRVLATGGVRQGTINLLELLRWIDRRRFDITVSKDEDARMGDGPSIRTVVDSFVK
jgi:hypothetical protein